MPRFLTRLEYSIAELFKVILGKVVRSMEKMYCSLPSIITLVLAELSSRPFSAAHLTIASVSCWTH